MRTRILDLAVLAGVLLAVLAWRWASEPLAVVASLVALTAAWLCARTGCGRRLLPIFALLAALLSALRLFGPEAAFPCNVACEGGGAFARIAGVDVLWLGLVGYSALALLAWRRRHRPVDQATAVLAWLLAGGSLAYLVLGWHLELVCRHCLAVHTVMVAAVAGASPTRWRWLLAITTAVVLTTGLLLAVGPPPAPSAPMLLDHEQTIVRDRLDAARRHGPADAAVQIDLVLDLHCPICARRHRDWQRTTTAVSDVSVTTRILVRAHDVHGHALTRWIYASAHQGQPTFQLALSALLGSHAESTPEELRLKLSEVVDVDALDAWLIDHGAAVDALIAADQVLLRALNADRRTPTAVLRQGDRVLERVSGDRTLTPLVERAQRLLQAP